MHTFKQWPVIYRAAQIFSLLALLSFLTSCVDLFESQYSISNLENGKVYVSYHDDTNRPAGVTQPPMPEKIEITYTSKPSTLPVYLNGFPISDKFTLNATSAEMNVSAISDLLKQGINTLMVDPLGFGPRVSFTFDNDGPLIDVTDVEELGSAIGVTLRAVDSAGVNSVTLQAVDYAWDGAVVGGTGSNKDFKISKHTDTGSPVALIKQPNSNNEWQTSSQLTKSNMYKITALDSHGYKTVNYYLSPEEKINDVFKLRMNKEVLDNAIPLVESKIQNMSMYAPKAMAIFNKDPQSQLNWYSQDPEDPMNPQPSDVLDSMSAFWRDSAILYTDMGAKTTNPNNCGYINTKDFATTQDPNNPNIYRYAEGPYFQCTKWDGNRCNAGDWHFPTGSPSYKEGECSRIILWNMELSKVQNMSFTLNDSAVGRLDLNMQMRKGTKDKALYTRMGLRNIKCGKRTEKYGSIFNRKDEVFYDHYCYDNGGVMAVPLIGPNLGDMYVKANAGEPSGGVKVLITNGALDLDLPGMSLNLSGLEIGSGFDIFIGALSGILDSLFVNIVKGVLQENLKEFILGFDLFTEWDSQNPPEPSMQMQSQAYQTYTNADNNAATKLEWFMQYAGFLKNVKQHPEVPTILGSRYTTQPVLDPEDSGSVLDMAINVNIINQALASMYLSGITHITVTSLSADGGKALAHFGPSISDTYPAISGDKRVELVPRTPGVFEMKEGTNGTQASLYYRNAQMNIQTYNGTDWKNDFVVEVDMRIGVIMTTLNDRFQLKVLGTPELVINTIRIKDNPNYIYNETSGSSSTNINIGADLVKGAVQFAVNLVLNVAIPQVAEQVAELEFPGIAIPETPDGMYMSSKTLKANNGEHLEFGFGMEIRPCTVDTPDQATCNPE